MSTLLIAEDDESLARAFQAALEPYFRTVITVETLEQAIQELEKADAVLLDLHLPDASGLVGLRTLRCRAPELPIAVITGADGVLTVTAIQAGADAFIRKPASLEDLYTGMFHAVLQRARQRRVLEAAERLGDRIRNVKTSIRNGDKEK